MKNTDIDVSVIVPVFNVEEYLPECIDSLLQQYGIRFEIILIDDGSTDRSGAIADQYAQQDERIKVIHQVNGGLSAARNAGISISQGKYVVFVDSDDRIGENSLNGLYLTAIGQQADIVMGKVLFCYQDGSTYYPFKSTPDELVNLPISGENGFCELVKCGAFPPMAVSYIYRRDYLEQIHIRFEENLIHEDELWTPQVLCQASRMVITDFAFYHYRQREGSIMHSANPRKRINSLVHITDRLMQFADQFEFSGDNRVLKNWLFVNIYRLYSSAFNLLSNISDTLYALPAHRLDRFWRDAWEMMPEAQKICKYYFRNAEQKLKQYTDRRISEWVASVDYQYKTGKKIMLIYNLMWGDELTLKFEEVPAGWVITTDRRFFQQAAAVVFHLPNLCQELECDLDKPSGQIWVGWYLESEKNYSWINLPEIRDTIDLWMCYRQNADVVYPYYLHSYPELLSQQVSSEHKWNKTCMFVSSPINKSGRMEYLKELMEYTEIDSYGGLFNNKQLPADNGRETKLDIYRNYKFVIAFENAIDQDYVTEKFFDPLIAGTVPIYSGAPNIEDFIPGDHCFLHVKQFDTPRSLARFINTCYEDEQMYARFSAWKKHPIHSSFLVKAEEQKEHPLVRLCRKIEEKHTN